MMAEIFCEHGYVRRKRCPVCGSQGAGPGGGSSPRASVWNDRALDDRGDDAAEWRHLGELGPGRIDYSRASGWRPLREFLQWRP